MKNIPSEQIQDLHQRIGHEAQTLWTTCLQQGKEIMDQVIDHAQSTAHAVSEEVSSRVKELSPLTQIREEIKQHPFEAVCFAAGLGTIIGIMGKSEGKLVKNAGIEFLLWYGVSFLKGKSRKSS